MRMVRVIVGIFFFGSISAAQAPTQFEVTAIKPGSGPPRGCRGGPGTSDPGRMSCSEPLTSLVRRAYQVKSYQFMPPEWMQDSRFEIDVKIPAGATLEQTH